MSEVQPEKQWAGDIGEEVYLADPMDLYIQSLRDQLEDLAEKSRRFMKAPLVNSHFDDLESAIDKAKDSS